MLFLPARKRSSGVVHIVPLFVAVFLIGGLILLSSERGQNPTKILSESDSGSSDSRSGSSDSDSSGSGKENEEKDESVEVRTEMRLPSGVRIRTREEEGRRRVDVYEGGRKLRIETRGGKTVLKVENEEEEVMDEEEFGEEQEFRFEVKTATGEAEVKIKTRGNKFVVKQEGVEAHTSFPLSIDLATNELIVTTPAGVRRVAVLPQQAVDNMIRVGHVDVILPAPSPSPSPEASPEVSPAPEVTAQTVEITEEGGEIVYVIRGANRERFLGLVEVLIPRTLEVSAETGELVRSRQSLVDQLLSLLSFE